MKKFLHLLAVFCLCAVWSLNMNAETLKAYELTFDENINQTKTAAYSNVSFNANVNGNIWTLTNFNNNNNGNGQINTGNNAYWTYVKCGAKSSTSGTNQHSEAKIYTTFSSDYPINQVVVNCQKNIASSTLKLTLNVYNNEAFSDANKVESKVIENVSFSKTSTEEPIYINLENPLANKYYELIFDVDNTTTTNGAIQVNSVIYNYNNLPPVTEPVEYIFDPNVPTEMTVGDEYTLIMGDKYPSSFEIISVNDDIATVSEEYPFIIKALAPGTAEFTAMWDDDDDFTSGEKDFSITVVASTDPNPGEKLPAGLSFKEPVVNKTTKDSFFNIPVINPNGIKPVTYTSSNSQVAIIETESLLEGFVSIIGPGETTITATTEETEKYLAGEASYKLIVTEAPDTDTYTAVFYATSSNDDEADYKTSLNDAGNISGTESTATKFEAGDVAIWIEKINTNSTSNVNGDEVRWYKGDILHIVPLNNATLTEVNVYISDTKYNAVKDIVDDFGKGSTVGTVFTWNGNKTDNLSISNTDQTRFNKITITYELPAPQEFKGFDAYKENGVTFTYGNDYSLDLSEDKPEISYVYDPAGYINIDEKGKITAEKFGNVKVTANWEKSKLWKEGSASFDVTVNPPNSPKEIKFMPESGSIDNYTLISLAVDEEAYQPVTIQYAVDNVDGPYVDYTEPFTLETGSHTVYAKAWNIANEENPVSASAEYNVEQVYSYTIIFNNSTTGSDSSSAYNPSSAENATALEKIIYDGVEYVSEITGTNKAYSAKKDYGVKLGDNTEGGYLSMNLVDKIHVNAKRLIVNAAQYGSDPDAQLRINSQEDFKILSGNEFNDYIFEVNQEKPLDNIDLSVTSGRGYVKSITVYYTGEEVIDVPLWAPTFAPGQRNYDKGTIVTVSNVKPGALLFGTVNGEEINGEVMPYTYELKTPGDVNFEVYAAFEKMANSPIASKTYTVKQPEVPLFSLDDKETVKNNSIVTISSNKAESITVRTYRIDGSYTEETIEGNTTDITVDKMHRRFEAYYTDKDGDISITSEKFYKLYEYSEPSRFQRVTSVNDLSDKDQIVIGAFTTYKYNKTDYQFHGFMGETTQSNGLIAVNDESLTIDAPDIVEMLPEGTAIYELILDGENTYKIKLVDKESYLTGGDKSLTLTDAGSSFTASVSGDNIVFKSDSFSLQLNANQTPFFGSYSSTQTPIVVYKAVESKKFDSNYSLTLTHTPYRIEGDEDSYSVIRRENGYLENSKDEEFTADPDNDGVINYTANPSSLTGELTISLDGETVLQGHSDEATDMNHSQNEDCDGSHDPYVVVKNGQDYKLVTEDHDNAVPLSTNPFSYHSVLTKFYNPTVKVTLDPFKSITLNVTSNNVVTAVDEIISDIEGAEVYFNLQGVKVTKPEKGGVYIIVKNGKVSKVIF